MIMTIIHEVLAETGLGQLDSGTLVQGRRSADRKMTSGMRSYRHGRAPRRASVTVTDCPRIAGCTTRGL
jgi:hypothetical protein